MKRSIMIVVLLVGRACGGWLNPSQPGFNADETLLRIAGDQANAALVSNLSARVGLVALTGSNYAVTVAAGASNGALAAAAGLYLPNNGTACAATRLCQIDNQSWISVTGGTATLWRTTTDTNKLVLLSGSFTNLDDGTILSAGTAFDYDPNWAMDAWSMPTFLASPTPGWNGWALCADFSDGYWLLVNPGGAGSLAGCVPLPPVPFLMDESQFGSPHLAGSGTFGYPITTNASPLMTQADFAAAQIGAISNRQSGVTLSGTFNASSLSIGGTNIPGWTLNQVIACAESNPLTTNTFSARWYPPKNCWLIDALPSVIYPATGTNLQVSLERENTRIATLSIPSGQYVGSLVSLTNAPLTDTNYISVRILRIGTGEGGGGLSVRIRYGMAP